MSKFKEYSFARLAIAAVASVLTFSTALAATTASREWANATFVSKVNGGIVCFDKNEDDGISFTNRTGYTSLEFGLNTYLNLLSCSHLYGYAGSFFDFRSGANVRFMNGTKMWLQNDADFKIGGSNHETGTPLPVYVDGKIDAKFEAYDFTRKMDEFGTNYMKRGWAKYTSFKGIENVMTNATWIDTPKTVFAAGKNWEKTVEVDGRSYYVLQNNGVTIQNGLADESGVTMTFSDFRGNPLLRLQNGSYFQICPDATSCKVEDRDGHKWLVATYASEEQPKAMVAITLEESAFIREDEPNCPAVVEWTGFKGAWTANVCVKDVIEADQCFLYAVIPGYNDGDSYIETSVPLKVSRGIEFPNGLVASLTMGGSPGNRTISWTVYESIINSCGSIKDGLLAKGRKINVAGQYLPYIEEYDKIKAIWNIAGEEKETTIAPTAFSMTGMTLPWIEELNDAPLGTEVHFVFSLHAGIKEAPVQTLFRTCFIANPVRVDSVSDGNVQCSSGIVKGNDIIVTGTNLYYIAGDSVKATYNTYEEEITTKYEIAQTGDAAGTIVRIDTYKTNSIPHDITLTPKSATGDMMKFEWPSAFDAFEVGQDFTLGLTLNGGTADIPSQSMTHSMTIVNPVTVSFFGANTYGEGKESNVIRTNNYIEIDGNYLNAAKGDKVTFEWETEEGEGDDKRTVRHTVSSDMPISSDREFQRFGWNAEMLEQLTVGMKVNVTVYLHGEVDGTPAQTFEFANVEVKEYAEQEQPQPPL